MGQAIHPHDVLFFTQVAATMRRVGKKYGLSVGEIRHTDNPTYDRALGYCHRDGTIEITIRAREDNGQWAPTTLSPEEIWKTAAHELAHLRYFNHGLAFQEFEEELYLAMRNEKGDFEEKDKIIDKLHKLQRAKEGEAAAGNLAAAEAFAAAINKMLIDHELSPSTLEDARSEDPIIELPVNMELYGIKAKRSRIAWQESLARIIAQANLCRFLIVPGSNRIYFVGTRSHATVAEYTFGTLVPTVELMSDKEAYHFKLKMNREGTPQKAKGFREAWQVAFIERLRERLDEAREQSINQAVELGNTERSTALVVLKDKMVKVDRYIDDKFRSRRKYAARLNGGSADHTEGRAAGRAAADRLNIGKKGIGSSTVKGVLK